MYRNTYIEINLINIKNNIKKIIDRYNDYTYYFGVVKADSYGHNGNMVVRSIVDGGVNYLAVATLEEALEIRRDLKEIPILCLGIINPKYLKICEKNNITVTVSSLKYARVMLKKDLNNIKVHIKLNTGMNRLGIKDKNEFYEVYGLLKSRGIVIEGIYTHIYNADSREDTDKQINKYIELTSDIDKDEVLIFHMFASDALVLNDKIDFVNGCRLGIIMYGFTKDKSLDLSQTFRLISEVIQINTLRKDETLGYNAIYKAEGNEKIAVIPCGYADGIIRKNTGRYVYINDKRYEIVGNICMDMLFVKVDDTVKEGDQVLIIKDINHIEEIAKHLETIPYEVLCLVSKRVPRKYVEGVNYE